MSEQGVPEGKPGVTSLKAEIAELPRPGATTILMGGAVLASLVLAVVLQPSTPLPSTGQPGDLAYPGHLAYVPVSEIEQARQTLDPSSGAAAIEDAKSCKTPLAYVQLVSTSPGSTSILRIRSGSYLSPAFTVTANPQRIAIPFPAPYSTGKGILVVEGRGNQLMVSLTPGQRYDSLAGAVPINVIWTAKNPC